MIWAVVETAKVPMFDGVLMVGLDRQFVLEMKEELVYVLGVLKP